MPRKINTSRRRAPSDLRQLLEVRTRVQAETYDWPKRRKALAEMRELVDTAIRHGDADERGGRA